MEWRHRVAQCLMLPEEDSHLILPELFDISHLNLLPKTFPLHQIHPLNEN